MTISAVSDAFMMLHCRYGTELLSVELTGATLYRHSELEARVAELEGELAALKLVYNATTDIDKPAHNAQISSISRQSSTFNVAQVHPLSISQQALGRIYTTRHTGSARALCH